MNKIKNPFIHSKNSLKKYIISLFIALLPLVLYGFYKNGVYLYKKELITFIQMFKPLYLPFLGAFLFVIIDRIYYLIKNQEYNIFVNSNIINGFMIGMIVQPKVNILLFICTIIVSCLVLKILENIKVLNINSIAFSKIIFCFSFFFFSISTYQNAYESSVILDLSIFDTFFGRSVGGISNTSVFLCLISYAYLCSTKLYKKEIPLIVISLYSILSLLLSFIMKDASIFTNNVLSNGFIFASIFIAPMLEATPLSYKGRRVYSFLLVFTMIATSIFLNSECIYISIAICSLFTPLINKKYLN